MFVKLGDDLIHWPTALRVSGDPGFTGSLSVHTEYGTDYQPSTIKFAGEDKACLRELETESGSSSPARD